MKIAVYAIAKDESKHIERFMQSVADADYVLICDTGSSDSTEALATVHGASVINILVSPWRFDVARNTALSLLPADIDLCISLDLDEVLMPGWRSEIEKVWTPDTTRIRYRYAWSSESEFFYDKFHSRNGYSWCWMCHEYLCADSRTPEVVKVIDKCLVQHLPDQTKSRGQYLDLLKANKAQNPFCSRSSFYLAREFWYNARYAEAIAEIEHYESLPVYKSPAETWHIYYQKADCLEKSGNITQAEVYFLKAVEAYPDIRDPLMQCSKFYQRQQRWAESLLYAQQCLTITERIYVHNCHADAWGAEPHDLCAVAAYYLNLPDLALEQGQRALDLNPTDPRLQTNQDFYKKLKEKAEHGLA